MGLLVKRPTRKHRQETPGNNVEASRQVRLEL